MIEWPYLGYILSICFNEHIAYKVSTGTSKELPNFLFQIPMSLIYFITFTMEKVIKCSTNHPVLSMWVLNSSFKLLSILLQWLSKYLRPACNQLAFADFFHYQTISPNIYMSWSCIVSLSMLIKAYLATSRMIKHYHIQYTLVSLTLIFCKVLNIIGNKLKNPNRIYPLWL